MNVIGIRKEEKPFESRSPLVPEDVKFLVEQYHIPFIVEPSEQRTFAADDFEFPSVTFQSLKESSACIILGIKEMPLDFFEADKVYIFFSHTTKAQEHNMPMLKQIIDVGATLLDYEHIVDASGRRLIFFGNWAGLAGMSDTLRVLGQRLEYEGLSPNPFLQMKHTLECNSLKELKGEFIKLGARIESQGLPEELLPFVAGFAGYGNVSKGAQSLFDLLPHRTILVEELDDLDPDPCLLYKCVFEEHDMVAPIDPNQSFNLQDYYEHGTTKYYSTFHKRIKYLTVIMNCIYWSEEYPRLITKDFIKAHWNQHRRRLRVIGDISCDVEGAIEFTLKTTTPDKPAFTYLVNEDEVQTGVIGNGPVIMAIDNLPCELPREASKSFSKTLVGFVPPLARANFLASFEDLQIPRELTDAIIVYRGELRPQYQYLKKDLKEVQK